MARTLSAAQAKAEFAECVRRAEAGEAVPSLNLAPALARMLGA